MKNKKFIYLVFLFLTYCKVEAPKNNLKEISLGLVLQNSNLGITDSNPTIQQNYLFGILGDSWTDMSFSPIPVTDLRANLTTRGFRLIGDTLAGRTLATAISQNLHRNVIDQTGKNIKYMIVSLGGNDYQANLNQYIGVHVNMGSNINTRIATIQTNLNQLINDGNSYKISKYGGGKLIWIIHGYDYPNTTMTTCSVANPIFQSYQAWGISQGVSIQDVNYVATPGFDALNTMYSNLASSSDGTVKYVNLRATLGGPPQSIVANMIDCIHPNTQGFNLITNKFVNSIAPFIGTDR